MPAGISIPAAGPGHHGPLFAFLAIALWASLGGAIPPYPFPPVYVSATRIPQELGALGRRVVVLDSAAIAARAPASIADLLASLPGLHPRTRGPFGAQTDLEMAGASFSQVLVLIDGMRATDPQTGHHTLNLPVRPEDLERVEVLYGPGSSVHGPDAFGGVVNLVPRKNPVRDLRLSTRWVRPAEEGSSSAPIAGIGSTATLRYGWDDRHGALSFSLGKERADGYRPGTDLDIDRFFLSGYHSFLGGRLNLQTGVEDKEFGARDFYAPYPSREWTRSWLAGTRFQRSLRPGRELSIRAQYRRHRDRFVLVAADPAFYQNRHLGQSVVLESYLRGSLGESGQLIAGGEIVRETLDSSNLGDRTRQRGGLFAEYSHPFAAWSLGAGGRLDHSSGYGWEFAPSFRLARTWSTAQLFASAGRAFRAPSFTELYYRDPVHEGNPRLAAEYAWSWETGLLVQPHAGWHAQGSAFVRLEEHLIDYVRPVGTPLWTARNLGRLRTLGTQLELGATFYQHLLLTLSHTYLHKTRTLDPSLESKYVFTHPEQLVQASLSHPLPTACTVRWQLAGRQGRWSDDYLRLDLILERRCRFGQLKVLLQNLADQTYREIPGLPMPGRWFGLDATFEI